VFRPAKRVCRKELATALVAMVWGEGKKAKATPVQWSDSALPDRGEVRARYEWFSAGCTRAVHFLPATIFANLFYASWRLQAATWRRCGLRPERLEGGMLKYLT